MIIFNKFCISPVLQIKADIVPIEAGKISDLQKEPNEEIKEISLKSMDAKILNAFYTAIKISIQDSELPLEPSLLYAKHLKACTQDSLDFKKSTYKRVL